MSIESAEYAAIAETLRGIFVTGHTVLPHHPSKKILEAVAAATHITPAQAIAAYRMIHQLSKAEFRDAEDPISFRQKLLMAPRTAYASAC